MPVAILPLSLEDSLQAAHAMVCILLGRHDGLRSDLDYEHVSPTLRFDSKLEAATPVHRLITQHSVC